MNKKANIFDDDDEIFDKLLEVLEYHETSFNQWLIEKINDDILNKVGFACQCVHCESVLTVLLPIDEHPELYDGMHEGKEIYRCLFCGENTIK